MKAEGHAPAELPTSLFLAASVIITVLVALFLALSDELQTRLPAPIRPTAIVQSDVQIINTLPPASATPTPPPLTPTPEGQVEEQTQTQTPTPTPTPTSVQLIAEVTCGNHPASWQAYIVQPNDTLSALSIRYGATIEEIVQANCLQMNALFSGTTIYLPATYPTRLPCGPPGWWTTYAVRPGDTLFSLARRHGTTVYAIMQANCMTDSRIYSGRLLFLPPLPATVPPPPTIAYPTNTPTIAPPATPTVTATSLPSPTPTATSAVTPMPTATATPISTALPTPSPTPSVTFTPPATALPTATATPTTGPTNTAVPTPTATLPPTSTPTTGPPTITPLASATPVPSQSSEP